jgi:hypothetical protein
VVSNGGAVPGGGISDDFANAASETVGGIAGFSGYTTGSTPRWPSIWEERDQDGGGGDLSIGDIKLDGQSILFRDTDIDQGSAVINWPAIARAVNLHAVRAPVLEFKFRSNLSGSSSALRLDYSFANGVTTNTPLNPAPSPSIDVDAGWVQLATVTADGAVTVSNGSIPLGLGNASGDCAHNLNPNPNQIEYTCRIQLPPAATAATNRFSHYVKFRLRANKDLSSSETINLTNVAIKSRETPTSGSVGEATYLNWCEYSSDFPDTASFRGGFHCLGPSIDLRAVNAGGLSRNRMYIDTTDAAISFYYNREEDIRGISATAPPLGSNTGQAGPVILITNGASLANVICTRPNPGITAPTENCTTLVAENVFNPVGEYDRFNIFGRDTAPGNTCREFGVANKPCMQIVAFGADSSSSSLAGRARIAGAWIYMPWGLIGFRVNGCAGVQALTLAELNSDDSWNFGGRIWARSLYACGQTHFRVPPSSSASLSALANAPSSADINFVAWTGQDWVARASSGRTIGSVN